MIVVVTMKFSSGSTLYLREPSWEHIRNTVKKWRERYGKEYPGAVEIDTCEMTEEQYAAIPATAFAAEITEGVFARSTDQRH